MTDSSAVSWSDAALDVILEYLQAADAGHPPDARSVLAAHPELADELRAFFADQEVAVRQVQPARVILRGAAPEEFARISPQVQIADYELREQIGEGGMGTVYRAWQQGAEREVAVKVLRAGALTGGDRERFLFEARSVAGLEHLNIVRIYEVGIAGDEPFFSMELAACTLTSRIHELRGKQLMIAELLRTLAQAMDFAHRRGILHRDLKPANILLAGDGTPKVADFGLAKRLTPHDCPGEKAPRDRAVHEPDSCRDELSLPAEYRIDEVCNRFEDDWKATQRPCLEEFLGTVEGPERQALLQELLRLELEYRHEQGENPTVEEYLQRFSDQADLIQRLFPPQGDTMPHGQANDPTRPGTVIGTPSYMAPEQARAEKVLTVTTDVYSLGAILYQCLTGQPPFRADTTTEILRQVREEEPPAPRSIDATIDKNLEAICLKCLRKEPGERYADAAQLADDLDRFLRGVPIKARRVSLRERLLLRVRRQPLTAALTAGVILLAILLLGGLGWQIYRSIAQREEDRANLYVSRVALASHHVSAGQLDQADESLEGCPAKLRGWDWYYLRRVCRATRLRLSGHEKAVLSICYDPQGKRLLTGSEDGTARVWDLTTGKEVLKLGGHHGSVTACFIAQGKLVVTAGQDQNVRIRDARTGALVRNLGQVGSLAVGDQQGRYLATVGSGGLLRVHDLSGQKELWHRPLPHSVICLAMDSRGRRLAVASYSGPIQVFNVVSGERLRPLPSGSRCWAIAFSRDGEKLVAGHAQPVLWDLQTGKIVRTYSGLGSLYCSTLDFSPDDRLLAAPYRDGQVCVWEVESGRTVLATVRPPEGVLAAAFSPDGTSLAVTRGRTVTIETVDLRRLATAACCELKGHRDTNLEAVVFSEDGRWLASRSGGGEVLLYDLGDGPGKFAPRRFEMSQPGKGRVLAFCLDKHGATWLVAGGDNQLHAWQADSGKEGAPAGMDLPVGAEVLAVAPGARPSRLAVLTAENQVSFDDRTFSPGPEVQALACQPGTGRVATSGIDGRIRLWDEAGKVCALFAGHRSSATALAFSRDGRLLATGGADLTVRLWDTRRAKHALHTLHGHGGCLTGVAFTPDGRRLASCGNDGRIKIWDTRTGSELLTLPVLSSQVSAVAFSPDGRFLASCGHDGVVRLWDGSPVQTVEEE